MFNWIRQVLVGLALMTTVLACAPECEHNGQCPLGTTCTAGDCVGQDKACEVHQDCGQGEACRLGICVEDDIQCTTHTECPGDLVCVATVCRSASVGDGCAQHADCGSQLYCKTATGLCAELNEGRCWQDGSCGAGETCLEIDRVSGLGNCSGSSRACGGQTCGEDEPHCVEDRCVACLTADHCDPGEACVNGDCVAGAGGCDSDADCPAERPRCDAGTGLCYECFLDGDCVEGRRCINNACELPVAGDCTADADCPAERPRCVAQRCEQCVVDGDCGAGQICRNQACVDAGGGDAAYGQACEERLDCASGFCGFVGDPPHQFCTMACGSSAHCPGGSTCFVLAGHGVSYCLPGTLVNARFDGAQNSQCATFADCRSGICANTQGGPICQQDCSSDAHCSPGEACMGILIDEQQQLTARVCGGLQGTVANGIACNPQGGNSCRAGICDNTTNSCQPLCCRTGDCSAGLRCNPTRVAGNQVWGICGAADSPLGAGGVGIDCGDDSDCRSGWCLAGTCTDLCCRDADCGPLGVCRPYNLGTEQEPVLVNACQ